MSGLTALAMFIAVSASSDFIEGEAPETPDFSPGRKARSDLKKPST